MWINDGSCATRNKTSCGPGTQRQNRTCKSGTSDPCLESEEFRTITCHDAGTAYPGCNKTFGDWKNATGCITHVDTKDCGPGHQNQTRSCTDGNYFKDGEPRLSAGEHLERWEPDKCKTEDKERQIGCNTPCPCKNST